MTGPGHAGFEGALFGQLLLADCPKCWPRSTSVSRGLKAPNVDLAGNLYNSDSAISLHLAAIAASIHFRTESRSLFILESGI